MRESDYRLLQGFPLFRQLSEGDFVSIVRQGDMLECPPYRVLAREGEVPENLFVLVEGLFELSSANKGNLATVSFIRPPTAFIMAAIILNQPYLVSARSLVASRVFSLPVVAFRQAIAHNPDFAMSACREVATRYRDMVKELKNVKSRTAGQRLANWILTEANVSHSDRVELHVSKSILAARLAMTNEHLSRNFALLRNHGVQLQGRVITIEDRQALIAYAVPDPLIDDIDS